MEWHFRITGELQDPYKLSDVSGYVSRDALFKKLRQCYKMTEYSNQLITKLKLPYAKSIATIVHYNAKDVILSLLTDPRIRKMWFLLMKIVCLLLDCYLYRPSTFLLRRRQNYEITYTKFPLQRCPNAVDIHVSIGRLCTMQSFCMQAELFRTASFEF